MTRLKLYTQGMRDYIPLAVFIALVFAILAGVQLRHEACSELQGLDTVTTRLLCRD